jgi:hypothetical protein
MEKITGRTTLSELAIWRAKHGIEDLRIRYDTEDRCMMATLETQKFTAHGLGVTEAEAIDSAFTFLLQLVTQDLQLANRE